MPSAMISNKISDDLTTDSCPNLCGLRTEMMTNGTPRSCRCASAARVRGVI